MTNRSRVCCATVTPSGKPERYTSVNLSGLESSNGSQFRHLNPNYKMKTQLTVIAFVTALLLSALVGCSSKTAGLKEGGIYAFKNENGSYSVLKLLKVESAGAHVKIYSNQFDSPPTQVDESKLIVVGLRHKANETLGVADVPLKGEAFQNYKATFVQQCTVTPQELEGYNHVEESQRTILLICPANIASSSSTPISRVTRPTSIAICVMAAMRR